MMKNFTPPSPAASQASQPSIRANVSATTDANDDCDKECQLPVGKVNSGKRARFGGMVIPPIFVLRNLCDSDKRRTISFGVTVEKVVRISPLVHFRNSV